MYNIKNGKENGLYFIECHEFSDLKKLKEYGIPSLSHALEWDDKNLKEQKEFPVYVSVSNTKEGLILNNIETNKPSIDMFLFDKISKNIEPRKKEREIDPVLKDAIIGTMNREAILLAVSNKYTAEEKDCIRVGLVALYEPICKIMEDYENGTLE